MFMKNEKNAKKYHFEDAVIAVTYICNSRCTMCNIWKIKDLPKLRVEDIKKIPATLRNINISGGEPFLRPDLPQIVAAIKEAAPKARIIISSNGFSTALIQKQMEKIIKIDPEIGVAVSIDGMEEMHEKVRRIPDGFKKDVATLEMLRKLGVKHLRIGFTAGDYNIDELPKMYRFTRKMGIEMTLAAVHNSENYFQIHTNSIELVEKFKKHLTWLVWQELKTLHPKRILRAYFAYGLLSFILNNKRPIQSYGGKSSFFMDPDGWVYPSDISTHKMGNIANFATFDDLMKTPEAEIVLNSPSNNFDHSWMICTTRTAIRKNPMKVVKGLARFVLSAGRV